MQQDKLTNVRHFLRDLGAIEQKYDVSITRLDSFTVAPIANPGAYYISKCSFEKDGTVTRVECLWIAEDEEEEEGNVEIVDEDDDCEEDYDDDPSDDYDPSDDDYKPIYKPRFREKTRRKKGK